MTTPTIPATKAQKSHQKNLPTRREGLVADGGLQTTPRPYSAALRGHSRTLAQARVAILDVWQR